MAADDSVDELMHVTNQRINTYTKAPGARTDALYDSDDESFGMHAGRPGAGRGVGDDSFHSDDFESLQEESDVQNVQVEEVVDDDEEEEEEEAEEEDDDGIDIQRPAKNRRGFAHDEASDDDGYADDAEDFEALHGGGDDDEQGAAIRNLTVTTRSGKHVGSYAPKKAVDFEDVYAELVVRQRPSAPLELEALMNTNEQRGEKRKRGEDSTDEDNDDDEDHAVDSTSKYLGQLFKTHNIPMTDEIRDALKNIANNPDDMEDPVAAAASAVSGEPVPKRARTDDAPDTSDDQMSTDQIDLYIKGKYKHDMRNAGVNYEQFMRITCPLCAFGNMNGDAIYAPKLQMIRKLANHGAMRGHLKTTCMLVCFCWNKYILKPMIRRGRKIMRLTYEMAWEHIAEPHVPNPAIEMRLDLQNLSRMARIGLNKIYRRNTVTGDIEDNEKMFNATIRAIGAKHAIRKNRPENQAFYDAEGDYGDEYAGAFTNPYMQVHFGAKEPPHMTNRKANAAHFASEKNAKTRWFRGARK